jgi:hypothetical protein
MSEGFEAAELWGGMISCKPRNVWHEMLPTTRGVRPRSKPAIEGCLTDCSAYVLPVLIYDY